VSDTRSNDLIHVSFGCNTSANGNAFGYETERYGHGRMLRRRPLPVDPLEDLGRLSFDKSLTDSKNYQDTVTSIVAW
jgi:hypothetical protein